MSSTVSQGDLSNELVTRPARAPDYAAENEALGPLALALAAGATSVLPKIAEAAVRLLGADSAGVSVLRPEDPGNVFRCEAAAGSLAALSGISVGREDSLSEVCLAREDVVLFQDPAPSFAGAAGLDPRCHEVLMAPWQAGGRWAGTIWAVAHTAQRRFDREDARVLQNLGRFAAIAHHCNAKTDQVESAQAGLQERTVALRRANAALAEGEARLHMALSAARMGTWRREIAADRQVLDESLQRLLGIEGRETMPFREFLELVHPEDRRLVEDAFADSIRSGERMKVEFRVRHPNDGVTWLRDEGEVFSDVDGKPLFMTGACVDITELKEAEIALKQADRNKDEFIATLAHELRNPLTPLAHGLTLVRTLAEGDPRRNHTFEIMERQLTHLVRLVHDLLDVARVSAGKIELSRERIPLAVVMQHAIEAVRPAMDLRGHRLEQHVEAPDLYVDGDAQRLTQVFGNLLSNAAKYTPPGGRIDVSLEREGEEAVVRVRDNGVGIPAAALPHVFDLFSQVRADQGTAESGLGIGLSLVRNLTSLHGGTVQAESEGPGAGSTFTVRLPISHEAGSTGAAQVDTAARATDRDLLVLVADDNDDAADTLSMLIETQGHRVEVAHDGVEAVEIAERHRPDVAFLDIGMPRMNGLDAARRIRELDGEGPLMMVAVTGWGQPRDRERTREAGFHAHLIKPPRLEDLKKVLNEAQGLRKLRQDTRAA